MVGVKKIQTRRNKGAGSRQVSSSRRRPLSSSNAAEVYCICSLETALFLFGRGGRFYNPRIEAFLRGLTQSKNAAPAGNKRHSERSDTSLQELYRQYAEAVAEWKAIKRREKELKKLWGDETVRLCITPIDELSLEEMIKLRSLLEDMQAKVQQEYVERNIEPWSPAESCSSNAVESFECSASIASGSGSADEDDNNSVHERN